VDQFQLGSGEALLHGNNFCGYHIPVHGERDEDDHLPIAADSGSAECHGINRQFYLISPFHMILSGRNAGVENI
jgi:hypothetical protein